MARLTKDDHAFIADALTQMKSTIEVNFQTADSLDDVRTAVRKADQIDGILAKLNVVTTNNLTDNADV